MKLHTVLGVGFDDKQSFAISSHWCFKNGKFFVNYPHDGPRYIDDINIYKANCHTPKEVVVCCGFYNHKKHGLFTDREPGNNRDKITIALVVNDFIHFHDFKYLHKKKIVQYFKRQENSRTSLTILVLSARNNSVSFDIHDSSDHIRTFYISLSIDKKDRIRIKVVEVKGYEPKKPFWRRLISALLPTRWFTPL